MFYGQEISDILSQQYVSSDENSQQNLEFYQSPQSQTHNRFSTVLPTQNPSQICVNNLPQNNLYIRDSYAPQILGHS